MSEKNRYMYDDIEWTKYFNVHESDVMDSIHLNDDSWKLSFQKIDKNRKMSLVSSNSNLPMII